MARHTEQIAAHFAAELHGAGIVGYAQLLRHECIAQIDEEIRPVGQNVG